MFRRYLASSEFKSNILKLLAGTFIAQLISLCLAPFLSRIYTPHEFGEFATYLSLISPLSVLATGRYEFAIMLPDKDDDAKHVAILSIIVSIAFCALLFLASFIFGRQFMALIHHKDISESSKWILLVPLAVLMITIYQAGNYWISRKKAFKAVSENKVVQTSSITSLSLVFSFLKNWPGLVFADLTGRTLAAGFTTYQALKRGFNFNHISRIHLKKMAKKYRDFPLHNSFAAFLDSLSLNIPVLIVSSGYTTADTGLFNFSRQIIGVPLLMISMAISQVYYQRLNERKLNGQQLFPELIKLTRILCLMASVYVGVILLAGESLFAFVFGETWRLSGKYSKLLAFSFAIKFIVSPLMIGLPVVNEVKKDSLWKLIYFISICILFLLVNLEFTHFLFYYVVIELVVYGIGFRMLYSSVKTYDKSIPV